MDLTSLETPFSPEELIIIKNYLFQNIATNNHIFTKMVRGYKMKSQPGAVIASPSRPGPNFCQDYCYDWMRDSAIVMDEVISFYQHCDGGEEKAILKKYLLNYMNWVKNCQSQPPINGIDVCGEPKFNIDGTVFSGHWSRPQNDGAALRANTLIRLCNIFMQEEAPQELIDILYHPLEHGLIKRDLEYVARNWKERGAGVWEEEYGFHFFVLSVQRKALFEGAELAYNLGDHDAAEYYRENARQLEKLTEENWRDALGYYNETSTHVGYRGGGLGVSVMMGLMYGRLLRHDDYFSISSIRSLGTAYYCRYSCEGLYQINVKDKKAGRGGPMVGRYLDDIYDGYKNVCGHPWALATNVFAEFYYAVSEELLREGEIEINFLTKQFYNQACPEIDLGYDRFITKGDTELFRAVIMGLIRAGDNMLKAVKAHSETYNDGTPLHLSEQIDRVSGSQLSAYDLTWSYASLLKAMRARGATIKLLSTLK